LPFFSSLPETPSLTRALPKQDKYLRSVADFRNLQERTKRDIDSARQFAIQRFALDLVESIDNLDRALEAVPPEALLTPSPSASEQANPTSSPDPDSSSSSTSNLPNKDLQTLHSGLKMTESILMSTLKKHGLERFDPLAEGRKFDPRLDEATFMTKVEGREDGDVFHTQSKGFTLNGRVLRAAKVGVVRNS
jgi:molecular chaperone GrpE